MRFCLSSVSPSSNTSLNSTISNSSTNSPATTNVTPVEECATNYSGRIHDDLKVKITTDHKGLKIAHLNVRGIIGKINEVRLLLLDSRLDVLAITETHLRGDINSSEISVDGYKIARLDRTYKSGGGCVIFFSNNLCCYERPDLLSAIEAVWIDITCDSQKHLVGCIYRLFQTTLIFTKPSTACWRAFG